MCYGLPVALAIVTGACSSALAAQQTNGTETGALPGSDLDGAPRPSAAATRTTAAPEIDGVLDDEAWAQARLIDRFVQQKPDAGRLSTERTEVRLLYDDDALYIGAELYDSSGLPPIIATLQRDPNTRDGDAFGITLDTFNDGKNSFAFFINPGGAVRDAQTSDDGRVSNAEWEAIYDLETRVHDGGWTVEMAIPWSTLRFDGSTDRQTWGLNLLRRIRRKNEDATWAPMDRQWPLYTVSRAGQLEGIRGIQPGRNLYIKPYALAGEPSGSLLTSADTQLEGGLDLKYGVAPSLTLDLTFNTDFSQVEVDQQQVNLTRFSLFFPEKREFFLENAGIFQFGDQGTFRQRNGATNRDFTLFHSRRIGLTASGTPLPILGGGRVSGAMGPVSVGVLNMQTQAESGFAAENFTVGRLRAEVAPGLDVGGILINRSATSDGTGDNQNFGADLNLQAADGSLLIQSYLAGTRGTASDGSEEAGGLAGRISAAWRDPFWEVVGMYRHFEDDFSPGAGFVRRSGIRHGYGTVGIHPRVSWPGIQELNPYVETHYFADQSGRLETREVAVGLDLDLTDGSMVQLGVKDLHERVSEAFSVSGASVPSGSYDFTEVSAQLEASGARPLSGRINVTGGGYFGGNRFSVGGNVLGRLGPRVLLNLSAEHNRIDLPDQPRVTADVYGAKLDGFFSTRLLTSAFVQYNQATSEVITNLRVNWIHAPLSNLYLVLTERRDTAGDQVLQRWVTIKMTKLFSF
ncbi:MAG: carbohydrate binding family 9 domain-containing protein [Gemmatimonadetes bacterium]|nr:carbohydrate binding family 9 domain-containing protein [Gemmatimonadota bacterium]